MGDVQCDAIDLPALPHAQVCMHRQMAGMESEAG